MVTDKNKTNKRGQKINGKDKTMAEGKNWTYGATYKTKMNIQKQANQICGMRTPTHKSYLGSKLGGRSPEAILLGDP